MLTKGAIGNLINRYKAVLTKCNLINTFGSLAVASMLVLSGAGVAGASDPVIHTKRVAVTTEDASFGSNHSFTDISSNNLGGAIYVGKNRNATIDGVTFSNNHTQNQGGGAIYGYSGSTISINKGTFTGNYIIRTSNNPSGQAIAVSGNKNSDEFDLVITGSTFEKNGYDANGKKQKHIHGTVAGVNNADISIENTSFIDNFAKKGGALYLGDSAGTISGSSEESRTLFTGNSTNMYGGAVHVDNDSSLTLNGYVDFVKNSADSRGGAIYNEGVLDLNGNVTFTGNTADDVANDIHNKGVINVLGGTPSLGGGISGEGKLSIAETATLALDADEGVEAVVIDNSVTNAGTISVADAAEFSKTIESKDGVIYVADDAKLTITADKKSGTILGDVTITGNGDITLKGTNHVLSSTTGWDYANDKGKAGAVDVNITANSLTIDSEGYGIQNIAGKHTITAGTVDITASNGGHAIQVQGQPNAEVAINFGDGGFTALKKTVEGDDGHALYVLDSSDKSSSKLTIKSIDGTSGNAVITGDTRAAIAVMGTKAEASIQAGGDVTVSSAISDWSKSRKSAAVYVTGGKLDITAGETLTIQDTFDDEVNNAIGIAVGGEVALGGKNVDILGNVLSITPDASEDDFTAKKPAYGTDADRDYTGKWLDHHNGILTITAAEAITVDGAVDFYGTFTADAGTDITVESKNSVALGGSGKHVLTADGNVNITGATYGFHGDGGRLSVTANGDVNITGTTKTALYFAPSVASYVDPAEAQTNLTVSVLSTQGNVNIKTDGTDAHGVSTRGPLSIKAEAGDVNIIGKGRTAFANWFDNYGGNIGASNSTINAGGSVSLSADVLAENTGSHYKEAALYTQAGSTTITAGKDISIADTGVRANKNAVSIRDNGTVILEAGGNIAITGGVNSGTGSYTGGTFSAQAGGDIDISGGKNALNDRGTFELEASGNITLSGSDNVIHMAAGSVDLNAGGDVTIASTGADGIYFAPEPVNTLAINADGDVVIAAGGDDGYGIGNRGNVTIDGNNVTITGKGRAALADWTSAGMGIGNTTINADGAVSLEADILDENLETPRKNAVLYTQGNTVINAASITITDASERADKLAVSVDGGNLTLNAGGNIAITGSIKGDDASVITLEKGTLSVTNGTVDGFTGIFEQKSGNTKLTADNGFFGGTVNVNGGLLSIGETDASMADGLPALALGSVLNLKKGVTVNVGVSKARTAAAMNFAPGSMLVVDGTANQNGSIIAEGGIVTVENGAKLHINNAKVGETWITKGFDEAVVEGWKDGDLTITTSNVLAKAENAIAKDGNVVVNITAEQASTVFADLIPMNNVDTMMANALNDTSDAASAGIRMLSLALEKTAAPNAIDAVNEVSRAAVTAGVQNTSLRIADAASNTVVDHMSLSQHGASSAIHSDGVDFWAAPMYGNLYTSGMVTSGSSVRGQFGGLALGADLEAGQFLGGKFRLGAAIKGGGGQSETKGSATSTQNDYDFGGLNFYAGWNSGALNIIGSVGYGFGNHEVEMGLPVAGMNSAKADIDTTVFTADLRAEYQLKTDWVDVLPHAGVRYTALKTDAHDLKSNGSVLNSVERDTQNIVQFPVGVTLSKDFDLSGWNVKPMADVSVIPAAGDKKATTKVNFSGLDAWDSVNSRIMDSTSWAGTVGVQAEKGNFTLGLNYGVQASSNETDQNIQLKLGWKF